MFKHSKSVVIIVLHFRVADRRGADRGVLRGRPARPHTPAAPRHAGGLLDALAVAPTHVLGRQTTPHCPQTRHQDSSAREQLTPACKLYQLQLNL